MTNAMPTVPRNVARWSAIGCTVHVETREQQDLARASEVVRRVLSDVDAVASRFRDDSDLSRVNQQPGRWVQVDPLLVAAVRVALTAAAETDGLVHPLLGRVLVELGYDRTFTTLDVDQPLVRTRTPAPARDAWQEIGVGDDALWIPPDTSLDLGATAKAWCTDLVVAAWADHLDGAAVVSIGGDLRTFGDEPWEVAVAEEPDGPIGTMVDLVGALATSSTRVRRWRSADNEPGTERHHLVDPRTGSPAQEVWRTVTIAGATCVAANTLSTAAIVLGHEARTWLDDQAVTAARLVRHDGAVQHLGAWPTTPQGVRP